MSALANIFTRFQFFCYSPGQAESQTRDGRKWYFITFCANETPWVSATRCFVKMAKPNSSCYFHNEDRQPVKKLILRCKQICCHRVLSSALREDVVVLWHRKICWCVTITRLISCVLLSVYSGTGRWASTRGRRQHSMSTCQQSTSTTDLICSLSRSNLLLRPAFSLLRVHFVRSERKYKRYP